jgi:hypothetical protein
LVRRIDRFGEIAVFWLNESEHVGTSEVEFAPGLVRIVDRAISSNPYIP